MSPTPIGNYPSPAPLTTAPTPGAPLTFNGGTKISTMSSTLFANEQLGDVVVYADNAAQQILLGNPTGTGRSALAIANANGANTVTSYGTLYCPNFVGTTGISLSLGGPLANVPALTNEIQQITSDSVTAKAISASNQIFATIRSESYYARGANGISNLAAVSNVAFLAPVTFLSNASFCNTVALSVGTISLASNQLNIGPQPNAGGYPICVQTATAAGGVSIYAAGDITSFSDARWKEDIEPIADALDKVQAVSGYTFRRRERFAQEEGSSGSSSGSSACGRRSAGVLAQEMQAVLPEVVDEDAEGRLHVAYGNVSALLIEAVKDLARKHQALREEVRELREQFSV